MFNIPIPDVHDIKGKFPIIKYEMKSPNSSWVFTQGIT